MLEEGDEVNDDWLLSIEELVESDADRMRRWNVVEHARLARELIVAMCDVVHARSIVSVQVHDGVRMAGLEKLGNLNERGSVPQGQLTGYNFIVRFATSSSFRLQAFSVLGHFASNPFFLHAYETCTTRSLPKSSAHGWKFLPTAKHFSIRQYEQRRRLSTLISQRPRNRQRTSVYSTDDDVRVTSNRRHEIYSILQCIAPEER